jgi:hypothetical protein
MNLNYETTETDFLAFVASADRQLDTHSVAIDYDGEVIIDAEIHYPHVPSYRYKFFTHVRDVSLDSMDMMISLFVSLRFIFEEGADLWYIRMAA